MTDDLDERLPEDWNYNNLRKELLCPHGVGHPIPWSKKGSHGCDGCCGSQEFEEAVEEVRKEYPDAASAYEAGEYTMKQRILGLIDRNMDEVEEKIQEIQDCDVRDANERT